MTMDQPTGHQADGTTRGGDGKYTRSIETAQRDAEAARLRARGWSYQRIADQMGLSQSAAHEAVQRALRETVQEAADEVRALEAERLDDLWWAALDMLEKDQAEGDDGPRLQAIDRLLKIQARRAALLGLDMPTKVEQSGKLSYEIVGVEIGQL